MDWLQELKASWGRLLDRIEDMLSSESSRVRPTGSRTLEEVMQLWGKVTWPIVFLTRLRNKSLDDATTVLDGTEADLLRRSIDHAINAEPLLEEELRTSIGLADAYATLRARIHESRRSASPVAFDEACALLATAVREMQTSTGICVESDDGGGCGLLSAFTSLHVIGHLNVVNVTDTRESTDATDPTDATTTDATTDATDHSPHFHVDSDYYTVCEPGSTIQFMRSADPGELLVVSLRPHHASIMQHVCTESAAALSGGSAESLVHISRGVMFSDATLGIACLATSVLPDLGIELNETASKAVLSTNGTGRFFDCAFAQGLQQTACTEAVAAPSMVVTGGWIDAEDYDDNQDDDLPHACYRGCAREAAIDADVDSEL